MSTTRFFDESRKVIDLPYIIFTTKFAMDVTTGAKIEANLKGVLMYVNAEPTLELATMTIDRIPIEVWLPCVLLRGFEEAGNAQQLIRVIYDPHFVAPRGNLEGIASLTAEASRRPNTYDPLYRR